MGYFTRTRYYWKYAGVFHWRPIETFEKQRTMLRRVRVKRHFRYTKIKFLSARSWRGSPFPYMEIKAHIFSRVEITNQRQILNTMLKWMEHEYKRLTQHYSEDTTAFSRRRTAYEEAEISQLENLHYDFAVLTAFTPNGYVARQYIERF